jgi:hypothetical protein
MNRFYERAGKLVNDMFSHRFICVNLWLITAMMVARWPRLVEHPLKVIVHQKLALAFGLWVQVSLTGLRLVG